MEKILPNSINVRINVYWLQQCPACIKLFLTQLVSSPFNSSSDGASVGPADAFTTTCWNLVTMMMSVPEIFKVFSWLICRQILREQKETFPPLISMDLLMQKQLIVLKQLKTAEIFKQHCVTDLPYSQQCELVYKFVHHSYINTKCIIWMPGWVREYLVEVTHGKNHAN